MGNMPTHLRMRVHDAAVRMINSHFGNDGPRPEIQIPARPSEDTDCLLVSGIKDAADRIEELELRLSKIADITSGEGSDG